RASGAQVIVDDIGFFDEPFFEDGPVAAAVRAAVQVGISYHSAAGNDADRHLEQQYRPSPTTSFHDFLGGPVDNTDDMLIPPSDSVVCVLQWNDRFGGSGNDYDLYLLDAAFNIVDASANFQTGSQNPIEVVGA